MTSKEEKSANRSVLAYLLLPQILPRARALAGSGFPLLSHSIAVLFYVLRIFPAQHPCVLKANYGRYSLRQVLAHAAGRISFSWRDADKIAVFVSVLVGIVILALQFVILIFGAFMSVAQATAIPGPGRGPTTLAEFFSNPNPKEDLAFRALDIIFGIPGVFDSKNLETPTLPFHAGLHALFEFYSYGILFVGVFIIIYLTITIVLETAQTGIPFGERFNHAWVPLRLVLFFALLLPLGSSINLAQYMVLLSAKYGSNLATNGWRVFNESIKNTTYLGGPENLIARPNNPDLQGLVSFMQVARVCSWAEGGINRRDIRPYAVFSDKDFEEITAGSTPSYNDFVDRAKGGTMFVRFGEPQFESGDSGTVSSVYPHCGELALPIVDLGQPGSAIVQQGYLELISCLWHGEKFASNSDSPLSFGGGEPQCMDTNSVLRGELYRERYSTVLPYNLFPDMAPVEANQARTSEFVFAAHDLNNAVEAAIDAQKKESEWTNNATYYGWAGAGVWFNKIAEQNGALTAAIFNTPKIRRMPEIMEYIETKRVEENPDVPPRERFLPILSNGNMVRFETPDQRDVALVMNQLFYYWGAEKTLAFFKSVPATHEGASANLLIDSINLFFGTTGLFDMCKNVSVNPLAQLASIGRAFIERSIVAFGVGIGVGLVSGIADLFHQSGLASAAGAVAKIIISVGSIGLILGFLLYYILPFLPFIYFFFAFMTWTKSIFEAMVAMPLWALAHLSIDGSGVVGDAAENGYFYLLEIFLKPLTVLMSFLGGIVIFGTMVRILNQIFYIVLSNLSGHEETISSMGCFNPPGVDPASGSFPKEDVFLRGPVDEFFFTIIYAIIVYMMAMPCFKLVDKIPDSLLSRWLGAGVSSFGSQDGDPVQSLVSYTTLGSSLVINDVGEGLGSAVSKFKRKE